MGTENSSQKVILATHNAGKVKELGESLASLGWTLAGLEEFGLGAPAETGTTFRENAAIKVEAAGEATGLWALADDSGLEVAALDGQPGVATADFGGWEKLLAVMSHLPDLAQRKARFVCVLVLRKPEGEMVYFEGTCNGHIALTGLGDGGFGYDPVFVPEGETRTFAQMTLTEKKAWSHRGIAVKKLLAWAQAEAPTEALV